MSSKESLLDWCKRCTKDYPDVEIKNYTTSWSNGLAFNALLHSYRPDSFNFNHIISKSPFERLEHAFKIIKSDYYINLNVTSMEIIVKPDRNKILNLLNELYEKLNDENSSDEYENPSMECDHEIVKKYQEDVEDVLTWILGAEEKLNIEQDDNKEESLDTIQQIFQSLDDFTTESTDKQKKIEDVLREGQIIMKTILTNKHEKEKKEIQIQRDLLNDKWEELKNLIMDKQERLHNTLMSLQKKQLNDFSNWLRIAETKIASFNEIEQNLELVKEQYKDHLIFQNEVREHEPMVKRLSSMVIIIDECENPNFSTENLTDDLVDQLEALAEKWKNVCTITEEREITLNIWIMLLEQENEFNNWVMKIVKRIQDIEQAASEGKSKVNFLSNLMSRLDKMKKDVNVQSEIYAEMFKEAQQKLRKLNKDSQSVIRIKHKIETLSKQWNSILDRMNLLSNSIKQMYDKQNELTRKGSIRSQRSQSSIESQSHGKRYKLDKWKLEEWQKSTIEFIKNLRNHEQLFGINLENNDNERQLNDNDKEKLLIDDLDIKEQEILIYEKQDEFAEIELEYQNQVQLGNFLIEELENKTNEDTTGYKELLDRMKLRWNKLKDVLNEKQLKVDAYTQLVKLHSECDVMIKKLIDNNKRIDTAKLMIRKLNSKQNYKEINDIYSKYNLKNKLTLTQQDRVLNIEKEFKSILKQYPKFNLESIQHETNQESIAKLVKDLKYFLKYWNETNDKINHFQVEVENILKIGKSAKKKEETLNSKYPKLMNAIDLFDKWLIKTYQIVYIAQLNLYWNSEQYDEQLNSFKELEKDINNEKKSLDYINETGNKIIQLHLDTEWTPVFKNRVRDLNDKWNKTVEILRQKIDNLDNLKELVPKLDEKLNEFWIWLESAREFLNDSIEFGDFEMMNEQIQQYDALLADIDGEVLKSIEIISQYFKTIKDIIKNSESSLLTSNLSLNELSKQDDEQQQQHEQNKEFTEELNKKVKDAIENWSLFKNEANDKRDVLKESLKECKKINEKIDNFAREIEKIKCERLMINDIDFLNEHCYSLETTKERLVKNLNNCIKMKGNLKNLNETSQFKTKVCLEEMINKINTIESKCNKVINEINTICTNAITIKDKYNELCKMYNSRSGWLDKLEQIISRSTHELVDSEEVCDYLENLENHLRSKPENVCLDKVELLLKDLNDLFFDATAYVEKQEDRWFTSTAEAGNRNKQLEQMLIETQEFEKQLIQLEQKLGFIESNLDENINELNVDNQQNKLDVEQLEDKFKEANKLLNDLSEQINKLIAEQRQLAASRFKEQLKYLQINYSELDKRFNELKNLPNINLEKDTLIEDLKKVYDELQNRQLTNSETDLIEKKLYECTQPLGDLDNRINELQKSSLSLEDKQTDKSKSSKASILKSHSDLDLSSPTAALTNGLMNQSKNSELMENQDLNISNNNSQTIETQNQNNSYHLDNFNGYNNSYENQHEQIPQIPQAIEINLNNSNYLQEQDELFEESVDWPWERCITDNYVPYYKNHELLQCFWNHPNWCGLMEDLSELNEIYYAAYRTAIKLRTIQQTLFLNCIHITNMCKIFDTFDFINDNLVSVPEMISVFKRIYEDISAKFTPITNYGLIIDMALNWVLNLYDLDRTGYVNLLAFKISLVCLSRASIEEKYKVLYQLSADSKGFADRQSIGNLLKYMLEIPKLLGDVAAFGGSNFEPSIRSCFEQTQDKQQLNVKNFLQWVKKEPQCMVWLPLLHRLIIAEGSRHPNKCSICKAYPICGFRYKCLKCFNCDICQNCFLLRRPLNGHKNTHPIKEYCYSSSRKEVGDFSKIVRNKFKSSRKSFRKHFADSYLPVNTVLDNIDNFEETNLSNNKNGVSLLQYSPISTNREDVHNKMEFYANKLAEAELNETNSFNMNSIELKNLTNNSDNLDNSNLINQSTSNQQLKELNLSKSNSDEHDLIMNYCNILNGGNTNSSVLSNKFASLNDSLSKFSQTSSKSTSTQKRKLNGYLSSQDYLNSDLDEHQLIKSYCLVLANSKDQLNEIKNPNQVLTDLSENSKRELSFLINQLEKENYALESNYKELKKQKYGQQSPTSMDNELVNGVDLKQSREEMLNEQKQLGIISKALEERMKILEQHNQDLQIQLSKLKLKLDQDCK